MANRRIIRRAGAEKPPIGTQDGPENSGVEDNGECECEVDRFSVATISQPNIVVDPVTGLTDVIRNAWFVAYFKHNACCDCCEFRQYVRGFFELNGTVVPGPFPGFNFRFWQEDQDASGGMYVVDGGPDDVKLIPEYYRKSRERKGPAAVLVGLETA